MFHMKQLKQRPYDNFEGLRVALLLTFLSGFIDAYTFITQEQRFAIVQTGNLLYMTIALAKGRYYQFFNYAIPILFFMLGQVGVYYLRRFSERKAMRWHRFSAYILLCLLSFIAILSPLKSSTFTISALSFFASLQLETFKRVRGYNYTNTMMTGNLRFASHFLTKGLAEGDQEILRQGYYLISVILSFTFGVWIASELSYHLLEYSLYFSLLPMLALTYFVSKN